jgi:PAS domain S-box-containing protein
MPPEPSRKPRREEPSAAPAFSGTEEAWDVYRLLVENSYDLVGEIDVNGEYVYVNPSYTTALGYPSAELLGKSAFELLHPSDVEKAKREFKQIDGTTVLRFKHQNGAWKWLDCSFRQFTTPLGPRTALISRDISARKEAEIKFEALASLGSRLSGAKTQVEAARVVAEAAQVLCGWDAFSLDLYDAQNDLIRPVLMIDEIDEKKTEMFPEYQTRTPSPFVRTVLQDGPQSIIRKGNDFDPSLRPFGDVTRASASLLFVPISEGGVRLGVVTVQSYRIKAYSRADLKLLEVLAGHCAGTLGRIRAVDSLRESQARFEAFMENTPGAAWIKDESGQYIYANHSIESLLAKKRDEVISRNDTEVLPSDIAAQVQAEDKQVRESGSPVRMEKSLLPNDPHRWFICKFPFVSSSGGWFVGGLAFDITDQVQMQRSLRASEERFRTMFEASPVAIAFVRTGELLYANPSYRRIFALPPDITLNGRHFLDDFSAVSGAELTRFFRQHESAPASLASSEVRGLRHGGIEFPCVLQIVPVELNDGPAHLVFIADISEKRSLEVQLLQAQKMESIGRLAGGIAHDFANLLTVIQGHAARLERGVSNPAPSLDGIIRAAHKATELTRQLLAFSRKQTLQIVETDLNSVIRQTARMLERVIGEDITLRLHLGANLPLVLADKGLMEQLIVNLAITSRDSMRTGGNLTVRTLYLAPGTNADLVNGWENGAVCLQVEDNGRGIPREDLPQIFEPFFKTRTGTDTELRLATVYGIVQQHSAKIDVQSEIGLGTRFRIAFQASSVPASPVPIAAPFSRVPETILIVEDSADLRILLRDLLTDAGFQTLDAASHAAAIQLFETARDRISLIIADVFLEDGNGRELVRQLRKSKPSLKAILTTGYDPHQMRVKIGLEESERFLAKPFETDELLKTVQALLGKTT